MTERYASTYTDRDGIPLRIEPTPEDDGPGARLRMREPTVHVDAADAPELCRALLRAAARNDMIIIEREDIRTARAQHDLDQATRELAEAHRERDQARAEVDRLTRELESSRTQRDLNLAWATEYRDRYRAAWTSARRRAADWRQEAEDTRDIHRHSPDDGDWTVCGVSAWTIPATTSPDRVTCPRCRHTEPGWDVTAYRRGAESMRERAFRVADDYTVHRPIRDRIAGRIYALPLAADETPEASRDDEAESAEPGDEVPTLAALDDRVDTVENHTDHLGYRLDGLAHKYNRVVELLASVGDSDGRMSAHMEAQTDAVSSHMRVLADLDLRVSELADQITAAGTAAQLAHTRLDQREPSADIEGMSERVATLEQVIRTAATTADVRNAEDCCDDRDRSTKERLAALENRALALEQGSDDAEALDDTPKADINNDDPLVYAVRRAREEGGHR